MTADVVEKLLNTVIESQASIATGQADLRQQVKKQAADIEHIKESMIKIVRIEERQINDKEGLNRVGKHVDRHDADILELRKDIKDLQISEGKITTKLTLMVAGITIVMNVLVGVVIHAIKN